MYIQNIGQIFDLLALEATFIFGFGELYCGHLVLQPSHERLIMVTYL